MSATTYPRWLGLAGLAAAAIGLAACGSSKAPSVASARATTPSRTASTGSTAADAGRRSTITPPNGPTKQVDEWAACERSHGNPNQPDPAIDAHGVIHITTPMSALRRGGLPPARDAHAVTGSCSRYLAAAQRELRAAHPVRDPEGVGQAAYMKYVACMRTHGVPNYPSQEPNDPRETNFIGSGVNPNSPRVLKVNDLCGKKLGLPIWWIKGWGPPGDITVGAAGLAGSAPACAAKRHGCGNRPPGPE
jgi:hypothetical protein